ncbi:MAG: condensation domain-containing protein, partial [Acidobacteriota bacterium]
MTRHDVEAIYPLAAAQEGILFDCLVARDSGVYVAHLSCLFEGQLDIEAFRQAWQVLTARHAALRTVFLWQDLERPLQVVRQNAEVPLTVDDWRPLSPLEQAARLADWLRRDRATPYDLGRGPLHRLALLRCTDEAYRFVWSRHHLILDGWSLGRLLGELFEVYEAARAGRQATLPKAMSHRAYLRWLERQDLAASESYWRRALAGFSHPTSWGASGPTTHGANGSPSRHRSLRDTAHPAGRGEKTLRLSAADSRRLEDTARRLRVTPNTLVQGAWAICASRFSG